MIQVPITDNISIGEGYPLVLIGGPCVIESEDFTLKMAEKIQKVCDRLAIPFIFKSSFDKANRTSIDSFRGQKLEKGLKILIVLDNASFHKKQEILTDIENNLPNII